MHPQPGNSNQDLVVLSRGLNATVLLIVICEISHDYWHRVDRLGLEQLSKKLHAHLTAALSTPPWGSLALVVPAEPALPGYPTDELYSVLTTGAQAIADRDERPLTIEQLNDPLLQESVNQLRGIIDYQCIEPDPEAHPEFRLPSRGLSMLRNYWERAHNILSATGSAEVGWDPHPLTRLLVSLQERIQSCLRIIGDQELSDAYVEADGVLESVLGDLLDFSVGWDCGDSSAASRFHVAIEKAWLRVGAGQFSMTFAEQTFLENVDGALAAYRAAVAEKWGCVMNAAEARASKGDAQDKPTACTVAEYIGQVELALRRVVSDAYSAEFGSSWPEAVRRLLSTDELTDTEARLDKEGQSRHDIVHFLNPQPLRRLVTSDWNLTSHYFPGKTRKQINKLLDDWLAARTKSAHNRPEHLWPEIEQQRARVACYDLLDSIAEAQRTENGSDSRT